MRMITWMVGVVVLTGCASQPAPVMDAQRYTTFAQGWVGLNRCIESGVMDPSTGALGKQYLQVELGEYTYDANQLNQEIRRIAAAAPTVPASVCNQIATGVMAEKNKIDAHNVGVRRSEQVLQNTLNQINNSRPIYCNTVGGVTMCN